MPFGTDGTRIGHGGIMRLDSQWPTPATSRLVRLLISSASSENYPPLAHLLLRDARAAWYRGQMHTAILDAATATEISLAAIADQGDATRFQALVEADMAWGQYLDPRAGRMTFGTWADTWLYRPGKRAASVARDRQGLAAFLPHLGSIPLLVAACSQAATAAGEHHEVLLVRQERDALTKRHSP